jgi:putative hydrolases of HD superfamily
VATSLNELLDFITFTHDIRDVQRSMWVRKKEQYENDSEHSFQLALVALYIIEHNELLLDPYRTMALALVHDILEVHAGDTFIYGKTIDTKNDREAKAIKLLKKQWPDQKLMLSLIDEYELKASPESKFVYALDKLVPILNNLLDDGRSWKRENITLQQVIEVKSKKISVDKEVQKYYELALDMLRSRPELFSIKDQK